MSEQKQESLSNVMADRREKFDELTKKQKVMYPNDFRPEHLAADLQQKFDGWEKEKLEEEGNTYSVAGRVMFLRMFGKLAFVQLQDRSGRIQASIAVDGIGQEAFDFFKEYTDMGDLVGVEGTLTRTRTGELTIHATTFRLLNKTLRPLPDKFHGLSDVEQRYRMRYVDLFMNPDVRDVFVKRSQTVQALREFFLNQDFLEVETPMLHTQHGGAAARPFETHHNALDMSLCLRIAPELHLKRLVVGGLERVFEINRNFRNEGISVRHNPEFTMIEAYHAHMDYKGMMALVENAIAHCANEVCGGTDITYGEHEISVAAPFRKMTMGEAIVEIGGVDKKDIGTLEGLKKAAKEKGVHLDDKVDYGHAYLELFEELCEEKLIQPTFITDYPKVTSPLARGSDADPDWAERAELFVAGRELSNLFSELNDPTEQAARFHDQVTRGKGGDDEAMPYDHDYVRALEYGMMPTAGMGIGIDRLVMLLTNQPSIRDVILFPTLRPESGLNEEVEEEVAE